MNVALSPDYTTETISQICLEEEPVDYDVKHLQGAVKKWIRFKIRLHLFILAIKNYRSLAIVYQVLRQLYNFKNAILGGSDTKLVRIGNKYYHDVYAPGFPSQTFDDYIEGEFNRIYPLSKKTNPLTFLFLAVTKKCPLQCEHCFEWDHLNKKESLSLQDLKLIIKHFQSSGLSQFHLSGGEPMTRIKDLTALINEGDKKSEFYVLTSGFNFTRANAKALKQAGLTGVIVSLDHFDAEKHNAFRGFNNSYNLALNAVRNAQREGLVATLSICVTRSFMSWNNLLRYAVLAKDLQVAFVQVLEPKPVGHYKGKDVLLSEDDLTLLEKFYRTLNFDPAYKNYPVIIYHGYHQRRVGCLSGGDRNLYIDSDGYVNACPFCQTRNFNIIDAINAKLNVQATVKTNGCQLY